MLSQHNPTIELAVRLLEINIYLPPKKRREIANKVDGQVCKIYTKKEIEVVQLATMFTKQQQCEKWSVSIS